MWSAQYTRNITGQTDNNNKTNGQLNSFILLKGEILFQLTVVVDPDASVFEGVHAGAVIVVVDIAAVLAAGRAAAAAAAAAGRVGKQRNGLAAGGQRPRLARQRRVALLPLRPVVGQQFEDVVEHGRLLAQRLVETGVGVHFAV